ncbi:hypothetical protein [Gracilinema caldarium]|uniref:hypothetical protein n=1 Tax=Gracilinema caldarium TaxID=215591 RepID=UPI0003066382|nr:hypothetical protein [Gracilinema caldarium]
MNYHRILHEYLLATENEISIDSAQYKRINIYSHSMGCLPRPSRWSSLLKKYGLLLVFFAHVLRVFWVAFIGCIYALYEALVFAKQWKQLHCDQWPSVSDYILSFSYRASKIVPQFIVEDYAVITMPWEPAVTTAKNVSLCVLLDPYDIVRSYVLSIASILYMSIHGRLPWILQTFTAFRWFVAYLGISKLEGHLYIAEHYDRWAVLADVVAGQKNGRSGGGSNKLSLIQHGSLKNLAMDESFVFDISLEYRMNNVQELFVYDEYSKNIFLTYIIGKECTPKIQYFKPVISTVPMGRRDSRKILFVGHPSSELLQCAMEEYLRSFENIELYYKPHPKNPATSMVTNRTWEIIESVDVFPTVDYIVSYPSTLINEYENIGISAFLHPVHVASADLDDQIDRFKKWFDDNIRHS